MYEVRLTAENSDLLRKLVEAGDASERAGKKMESSFDKSTSRVGSMFSRLGSLGSKFGVPMSESLDKVGAKFDETEKKGHGFGAGLASVGQAVTLGLGAGLVAVGAESIHLADNFEASHARLVVALKNSGTSFSSWHSQVDAAENTGQQFGFTSTDIEGALASMTTGMGSAQKAISSLSLAENIAAARHISLAQAAMLVTKASEGQIRPLKQAGIDLPIAAGGALKVKTAFEGLVKAQDKAKLVEQQIADHQLKGKAAMTAYANAQAGLQTAQQKLNDAQTSGSQILTALGEKFGGSAAAQAGTFQGKVAALRAEATNLGTKLGTWLIPKLTELMGVVSNVVTWFEKHRAVAMALGIVIGTVLVVAVVAMVAAWVAANIAIITTVGVVLAVVAVIGLLVAGVIYAWTHFQLFRDIVLGVFTVVKTYVMTYVTIIIGLWHMFGSTIISYAKSTWDNIKLYIQGALNVITGIFNLFKDLFTGKWSNLWNDVKQILSGAWDMIRAIVGQALNQLETLLSLAWAAIGNAVKTGWSDTLSFFEGLPGKITGFFSGLVTDFFNLGANIIHALINGIGSVAGSIASAITSHIPHSIAGVKLWARGGIAEYPMSGGLAILHGREAILPLDDRRRSFEILAQTGLGGGSAATSAVVGSASLTGGGGGVVVVVNVNAPVVGRNSQFDSELALTIANQLKHLGIRDQRMVQSIFQSNGPG
jgi:phage-related protein